MTTTTSDHAYYGIRRMLARGEFQLGQRDTDSAEYMMKKQIQNGSSEAMREFADEGDK